MRAVFVSLSLFCAASVVPALVAQTQRATTLTGVVDGAVSGDHFVLKTDKGESINVATSATTNILHSPPGVTDPTKFIKMPLGELTAGDRIVAYYHGAAGEKSITATTLVVRTKADLDEIAKAELADWKKRGTVGNVESSDPSTKTITIKVGSKTMTVTTNDKTEYHRYSLDSAKPADAKPSTFADIKVGDQVHVLGNKNADGTSTTAESVYAGEFRQLAATVVSVNGNEMQVKDLATKKNLTVKVDSDAILKKLDPQQAAMLARRFGVGRGADGAAAGAGGGAGRGDGAGAGRGDGMGRGGRGGGDIGSVIDRAPAVQVSDLKPGDAIMVSTTMGSDPTRVSLVMLLAGVEPLLTAPNATRDLLGGWNLGGGGGGEGQ